MPGLKAKERIRSRRDRKLCLWQYIWFYGKQELGER